MGNTIYCNCIILTKTANHLCKKYDEQIKKSGISANQFFLLSSLKSIGPCTTTKLAYSTLLDRTTVVRNLKPLFKKAYIQNKALDNSRNNVLEITESGRNIQQEAHQIWKKIQEDYLQFMGETELNALRYLLSKTQKF